MANALRLLFTGDVVMNSKPEFSSELQTLLRSADLRSCNFEAPLSGFGHAIAKTGPHVAQAKEAVEWLKSEGFDLFSLANNHINDYSQEALAETIATISEAHVIGAGDMQKAYACLQKDIQDTRFGFMAFGENGFGALNGDRKYGHAWVNAAQVDSDIRQAAAEVDVLIVQVHAGVELLDVPIPEWRARYKQLIEAGADVLIAHHPHVLQGMEYHQNKPIFYSLGNFYFDYPSNHPQWNTGGLLELQFEDKTLTSFQMHGVRKNGQQLGLIPSEEALSRFNTLTEKIQGSEYEAYVDAFAMSDWEKHHKQYYAKPFNGWGNYSIKGILKHVKRSVFNRSVDYQMLWHNLFIESNKWLVERAIRNKLRSGKPS